MARLRRAAALATTVALAMLLGAHATSAQAVDPTVVLDRTGTAAGEHMLVTGAGWPNGATLIVELCGHGGLRGSVDCDVPHQRTAGVGPNGTFSVELTSGQPPAPCPCVVKVMDQASLIAATAPIAVAGIPTVPITNLDLPASRAVEISTIEITGGGTLAELFGAGGRRVLEVTLVNTGAVAVDSPEVSVAWGRGVDPDGFVEPPETRRMEPGETQTLTIALDRPALTLGDQTAVVEIQGVGEAVVGRAATGGYPWGLLALALVVVQLLLLRLRNRLRRRFRRAAAPDATAPEPEATMLALPPATKQLAPADEPAVRVPEVIDLDELEREDAPPSRPSGAVAHNGTAHATAERDDPHEVGELEVAAGELAHVHADLDAAQLRARVALRHAAELSEALVAAAAARIGELEAQAAERLREAEAHHLEALAIVAEAQARAEEVVEAATAAAAGALRDARADRAAAGRLLAEVEERRQQLVVAVDALIADARIEIDQLPSPLAAEVPELGQASEREPDASPALPRAPRLGSIDLRVADAVSRAVAATALDATATD